MYLPGHMGGVIALSLYTSKLFQFPWSKQMVIIPFPVLTSNVELGGDIILHCSSDQSKA